MVRKSTLFLVCLLWGGGLLQKGYSEAKTSELQSYQNFVAEIGNEIVHLLIDKQKPLEQRKAMFREVLRTHFSVRAIGKFVLANYWRRATPEQQGEYLKLFETAIVNNYAAQFDNYANEKLEVRSAYTSRDGGVVVKSVVLRPQGGEPLQVDWKIFQTKRGYKVLDLVVNGISMSITQRTEYRNLIRANGGNLDGLLAAMRQKN